MIVNGNKVCSICGIEKPITEFHKDSYSADGYRSCCKTCRKVKYKKRQMLNLKRMHKYYKDHKSEKSTYNAKYYQEKRTSK